MEPIQFLHYERMSDDIYFLGKGAMLRFNVGLASYKDGRRFFFHKEYDYEKNGDRVVTIRRSYDYYLSLENTTIDRDKEFIMITPRDFLRFKSAIEECVSWFRDKEYKSLFVQSKNNLVVTSPRPECEINGLPSGKYIRFQPTVIDRGATINDKKPGLCITLNNPNNFIEIDVDSLMGLYYTIKDLNMILMAQSMLAYLVPPENCNRVSIGDGSSSNYYRTLRQEQAEVYNEGTSGIIGRRIKPVKNELELL